MRRTGLGKSTGIKRDDRLLDLPAVHGKMTGVIKPRSGKLVCIYTSINTSISRIVLFVLVDDRGKNMKKARGPL